MHPLDNVVWNALTTRQANFSEGNGQARKFKPEVSTVAAFFAPTDRGYESLRELLRVGQTVDLALEEPYRSRPGWSLIFGTPMPQMVYEGNGALSGSAIEQRTSDSMVELGAPDVPEMMELTSLTRPGPFSKRTYELGRYIGIRSGGKLVAMAGERLRVPGYTEVSAVCTHPEYAGRGYARRLVTEIMHGIVERGEIPFLHVRRDNVHAIGLYERMGFRTRVVSHLAAIKKI